MLILASNTDVLQLFINNAGTLDAHVSWMDNVSGAVQPGRTNTGNITATGFVMIGPSPASGIQRNIKTVHVRNRGTSQVDLLVAHNDGTTVAFLCRVFLPAGATLQYIDEIGFVPAMAGIT